MLLLTALALFGGSRTVWAQGAPKVGVIVAGGSARGFAYLGSLRVLVAAGVPLDRVVGSSAGAIIGGLYGAGYSLETTGEILRAMADANLVRLNALPINSILDPTGFEIVYRVLVGQLRVEDTSPPLTVMATELKPGGLSSISSGDLAGAVRASMSLPGIFPVARFEGRDWVDGSLRDPAPTDVAARAGAEVVIAMLPQDSPQDSSSLTGVIGRTLSALIGPSGSTKPDATVLVPFQGALYLDFAHSTEFERLGEDAARRVLPDILEVLRRHGVPLTNGLDAHAHNPVNSAWRERFRSGLEIYRSRLRPLAVAPVIEFGPAAYNPRGEGGEPQPFTTLGLGLGVSGGPLGVLTASGGLVVDPFARQLSGFARLTATPDAPWAFRAEFDPARRPPGNPWRAEAAFLPGPFRAALALDARAVEFTAGVRVNNQTLASRATFTARLGNPLFGQAPAASFSGTGSLVWTITNHWQARGFGLVGLAQAGGQPFPLGAATLQRAYPDTYRWANRVAAISLEGAYRWEIRSVLGLANGVLDAHVFADGAVLPGDALLDGGLGVTFYGRWFGFAPFTIGTDLAFAPNAWRLNVFTRVPF